MGYTLFDERQRHLATGNVRLALKLLLDILDQLLTLRATAFVEARVDRIFIGIDQLAHKHTEQQGLAVTLRDTKATQELRGDLSGLLIGRTNRSTPLDRRTEVLGKGLIPEGDLLGTVTAAIPRIATPRLIPSPITIQLLEARAIGQLIGRVGPIPIGGLRIEVQGIGTMHIVHRLYGLLRKVGRSPAEGLQVGQNVHVRDMGRAERAQILVNLAPRATRRIGRQRLAVVFVHRVEVLVDGQCGIHHHAAIRIVRTQQHGRFVGAAQGLQTILDTRQNGLRKPLHIILIGRHCLTQADQQTHVRILLDKGRHALARIVAHKRCDRAVAILRSQAIVFGKGFREQDVIEHLNDEDTTLRSLVRNKRIDLLVLAEGLLIHFYGKGIILQSHKRGKGVSVPQIDRVHAILDQHIEILHPQLLIVEPREGLGRVGILIDRASGQVVGLLHTDAGAAQHHLGGILKMLRSGQFPGRLHAVDQFATAIEQTITIFTRHTDRRLLPLDAEALFLQSGLAIEGQDHNLLTLACHHLMSRLGQGLGEVLGSKQRLRIRLFGQAQLYGRLAVPILVAEVAGNGYHNHPKQSLHHYSVFVVQIS